MKNGSYNIGLDKGQNSVLDMTWLNRFNELLRNKYSRFNPNGVEQHHSSNNVFRKNIAKRNYTITCRNDGDSLKLLLPDRDNKEAIDTITQLAILFVKAHEGTNGQRNAARKKLTEAGYHITRRYSRYYR